MPTHRLGVGQGTATSAAWWRPPHGLFVLATSGCSWQQPLRPGPTALACTPLKQLWTAPCSGCAVRGWRAGQHLHHIHLRQRVSAGRAWGGTGEQAECRRCGSVCLACGALLTWVRLQYGISTVVFSATKKGPLITCQEQAPFAPPSYTPPRALPLSTPQLPHGQPRRGRQQDDAMGGGGGGGLWGARRRGSSAHVGAAALSVRLLCAIQISGIGQLQSMSQAS